MIYNSVNFKDLYRLPKDEAKQLLENCFYNDNFKNSKIAIYNLLFENNFINDQLDKLLDKMIICNINLEVNVLLELYIKVENNQETKQKIKHLFSFINHGNIDILNFFDSFDINNKNSVIELIEPFDNVLNFIIKIKNMYNIIEEFKPEETNTLMQNKIYDHIPLTDTITTAV